MNKSITSHLDYVTRSYAPTIHPDELLPNIPTFKIKKERGGARQYDAVFELENGGLLLTSDDSKQGSLLELSGQPLAAIRDAGTDDDALLAALEHDKVWKTTRIDYCWNIPNPEATVWATVQEWYNNRKKTRIASKPDFHGSIGESGIDDAGQTVYYGSPQSPNRVAVYDKATQMRKLGEALTRVELRARGEYAQNWKQDMVKHGALVAAQYKLKKTLDFPELEWWQEMYTGDIINLSPRTSKAANATKYLVNTVHPMVMKNIDDAEFIERLAEYMVIWSQAIADRMEIE